MGNNKYQRYKMGTNEYQRYKMGTNLFPSTFSLWVPIYSLTPPGPISFLRLVFECVESGEAAIGGNSEPGLVIALRLLALVAFSSDWNPNETGPDERLKFRAK
jgi:hypothetical protein